MLDPLVFCLVLTHHLVQINYQTAPAALPRRDGVPPAYCRRKTLAFMQLLNTSPSAAGAATKQHRKCSKQHRKCSNLYTAPQNILGSTMTLHLATFKHYFNLSWASSCRKPTFLERISHRFFPSPFQEHPGEGLVLYAHNIVIVPLN